MNRLSAVAPRLAPLSLMLGLALHTTTAAGAITATFSAGELTLVTDAGDDIQFNCEFVGGNPDPAGQVLVNGGTLLAQIPGGVQCQQVVRIVIEGDALPNEFVIGSGSAFNAVYPNLASARINGGGGDDEIFGSDAADELIGGPGTDRMLGRGGDDVFIWNPGDGTDTVFGEDGSDRLVVNGGGGADPFSVTPGDGSSFGEVTFTRNPGFSIFINSTETLAVFGNDGDDVIDASTLTAGLIALELSGGAGNDTIIGSSGPDLIDAGPGNDSVDANPGADTILLGDGDDQNIWNNGDGSDTVLGEGGNDRQIVNGGTAADQFEVTAGTAPFEVRLARLSPGPFTVDMATVETLEVNSADGDDLIDAGTLPANLIALQLSAGAGNDTIIGSSGADQIDAGPGNDSVDANPGTDTVLLGEGDDVNVWNNGDGSDTVFGDAGNDRQIVNGGAADERFAINTGAAAFDARFARLSPGPFTVDIAGVEALEVNSFDGSDEFNTVGLPSVSQFLNGGGPDVLPGDQLQVAGFTGDLLATPVITLPNAAPIAHTGFERAGGGPGPAPQRPLVVTALDPIRLLLVAVLLGGLGLFQLRRRG
jgi:Ca2+-binding RTX toxin-like protein